MSRSDYSSAWTQAVVDPKAAVVDKVYVNLDVKHVIVSRGRLEIWMGLNNRCHCVEALPDVPLTKTSCPQQLMEGAIEPIELVGIKNDSSLVAVAPFDGETRFKHRGSSSLHYWK
jgi:hypothetical protein